MNLIREYNNLMDTSENLLRKGIITLAEYREIEVCGLTVFRDREVANTISEKVKDTIALVGVHFEESGIGWKMVNLPFNKKSRGQWYGRDI